MQVFVTLFVMHNLSQVHCTCQAVEPMGESFVLLFMYLLICNMSHLRSGPYYQHLQYKKRHFWSEEFIYEQYNLNCTIHINFIIFTNFFYLGLILKNQ